MELAQPNVPNDYVLLTIKIKKTGKIRFLRPTPPADADDTPSTDSSVAVMVELADPPGYCDRGDIVPDGNSESVTFGVYKSPDARPLNIGIAIPARRPTGSDQMWLPIFLDPNVKNRG